MANSMNSGDRNLLVDDIQGNRSHRERSIFSRFWVSNNDDSNSNASICADMIAPVLLSLAVIIDAYILSLSLLLFTNNESTDSGTVYSLALISTSTYTVIAVLILVVIKVGKFPIAVSGDVVRPSWITVLGSGLSLGLGILGSAWANTPSNKHTVTASRNYFSLIGLVVTVFIGKHVLNKYSQPSRFGIDLCVTCLLTISLFLRGEVEQFDLEMLNNVTSHDGFVETSEMDYLWSAIAVGSYMLIGLSICIWATAIKKQIHWLYLAGCSSIVSVVPILISVAVRYSVWNAINEPGGISIKVTWSCIVADADSGCSNVASAAGWLFIITFVASLWLLAYYIHHSGDSLNMVLMFMIGVMLSGLSCTTFMNKSGQYTGTFTAASAFSLLAVLAVSMAPVIRVCIIRREPQLEL